MFDKLLKKFEEFVLSFAVLAMAAVLIGGVISRTVFNASWTFTEEVGQALNIMVTFIGIGYCARQARHISMSAVFDLANEKVKKILTLIITFITAVVMIYVSYIGFKYTHSVYSLGRTTPALNFPYWIVVLPLPVGFLLGALEYIRTLQYPLVQLLCAAYIITSSFWGALQLAAHSSSPVNLVQRSYIRL